MKIAILGGGNVYALNFAKCLNALGIEHFGIGRSERKPEPFWQVKHKYRYYKYHLIKDFDAVIKLLSNERPDVLVNFCAQGEGAASFNYDSHLFYATNTVAMVRLAETLREQSLVKRFVQISTSELYGSVGHAVGENAPLNSSSPYAISKAAFDQHLNVMHKIHGFPMNIIRPCNCYCAGQQLHRVIPQAIIAALSGRKMKLHGGGVARKSYLHATDLSTAIMAAINSGKVGETYNVGSLSPMSIRGLVEEVSDVCGVSYTDMVEKSSERTGQDGCYWLDSSKLISDTGWSPTIDRKDGILEMVEWVKKYPELLTTDSTYRIAA